MKKLYIYIYIQVEFHFIQNLNPIGIKISNQFVCCYLINPIKGGLKKSSYEQKEKKKTFFYGKKGNFSLVTKTKKKKQTNKRFFLEEQTFIIYRYFFLEEREGVYFKLKYLLPYLQFFFKKKLYPKTFLVNQHEQKFLSFVFPIMLLFFFFSL